MLKGRYEYNTGYGYIHSSQWLIFSEITVAIHQIYRLVVVTRLGIRPFPRLPPLFLHLSSLGQFFRTPFSTLDVVSAVIGIGCGGAVSSFRCNPWSRMNTQITRQKPMIGAMEINTVRLALAYAARMAFWSVVAKSLSEGNT